ncbi:MAG TPA: NUDIX hydrolase [Acidimicrobiales bacterium]|nr:NUDIX hydrolase [Acidimicrobiales bacterium]
MGMGGRGSGDGFVTVADGSARWGRFGASGLLARHVDGEGTSWYFLARRSEWTHRGGTWAIPGGAIDLGEQPRDAALREFAEEIGGELGDFRIVGEHEDDHGGWSYWTVVVDVPERFAVPPSLNWETAEARWVAEHELTGLELFDAFAATLARLGVLRPG